MKKQNKELLLFYNNRNLKKWKKEQRRAISKKHRKRNISKSKQHTIYKKEINKIRRNILMDIHQSFTYSNDLKIVKIENDFGLEESTSFEYFISKAREIIDFNSKRIVIDINDCKRVWPSAITLLCSLKEWSEFSHANLRNDFQSIASTDSQNDFVNSYLAHCGFYKFVDRDVSGNNKEYNKSHGVKIERIMDRSQRAISKKEEEIIHLLEKCTRLGSKKIKLFIATAIMEVFANVQEHGITCYDKGYYLLAEYHPTHRFISINIADNGIGFKNSLLSGPQEDELKSDISLNSQKEGDLIKRAFQENVSGAIDASIKEGSRFKKGYIRGAHRGNGLDRIKGVCQDIGIDFTILSHFGYFSYNHEKGLFRNDTFKNRIFAGTLYHFKVPCDCNFS